MKKMLILCLATTCVYSYVEAGFKNCQQIIDFYTKSDIYGIKQVPFNYSIEKPKGFIKQFVVHTQNIQVIRLYNNNTNRDLDYKDELLKIEADNQKLVSVGQEPVNINLSIYDRCMIIHLLNFKGE